MSFNIVDLVKDQISDQVLGQMGSILGTEGSQTSGALAGALPGLLSGLVSSSNNASGASQLFEAAQKQDDNLLGNMGNLLGSDQASTVVNQGSSMLSSIMGSGALGQLAGVVANFSGISRGNSSSLMGMLAPLVIGVIKKQIFDGGMDSSSMASMLSSQKDNVANAMPQGFSNQLQSAGFFDSIASAPQAAVSAPAAQANQSTNSNSNTAANANSETSGHVASDGQSSTKSGGAGFLKWLLPLVAVVVAGWFGLNYLSNQSGSDVVEGAAATVEGATDQAGALADKASGAAEGAKGAASDAAASALEAAQESMPEGVDLSVISGGLEGVFGSTTEALSGITDVASAESAVPAIEEATSKLGGMNDLITRLPDAAKGPIAGIANAGVAAIQPIIEKVSAIPGVGAVIEPVLQPMLDMLSGLAE